MTKGYEKLLSPKAIGTMTVPNRIVMPPMARAYGTPDGYVTPKLIDHYAARAKGGVGLLIVEGTYVNLAGKGWPCGIGAHDDKCLNGLSNLADAVQEWGSKIVVQLFHGGRQSARMATPEHPAVAPSAVPLPGINIAPKELTTEEVGQLVEDFARATARVQMAGFDGAELHAAHGYMLGQFLAANTNRRTDKYGGDLDGRMTIIIEIVQRTRQLVGNNFPLIIRLNAEDLVPNGIELEDCKKIAQKMEAIGIDAIDVSAGTGESAANPRVRRLVGSSMYQPRGQIIKHAAAVKEVVNIPVIAVGAITPDMGEEALNEGKADFIAIGRGLLADPEIVNKLIRGEPESIRPCIRCAEKCSGNRTGVRCTVNAECGLESYRLTPPIKKKKVLIIGGGVAGLEAARIAAIRGHDVTVYEKQKELGGHLIEATVPVFKEDLRNYKDWQEREVKKLGVKIELGKEVAAEVVSAAKPDALVVATGSTIYKPAIPGIDGANVVTAIDVLLGKAQPGEKTIIAGGGFTGCEVALHLAKQGKKVTIVEALPELATEVMATRGTLIAQLMDIGVEAVTNMKIIAITDEGVTAINNNKEIITIKGDKVILALGMIADTKLYEELKNKVKEVYLAGDSMQARRVGEATRDGYRIGSTI
ncbi:MAG: FAD-dependent oxidoreductase [Dehalococcoidales bacterium]|nr:FAD-dependent oxidoreductase [Dehalococcoidales bacterium]